MTSGMFVHELIILITCHNSGMISTYSLLSANLVLIDVVFYSHELFVQPWEAAH